MSHLLVKASRQEMASLTASLFHAHEVTPFNNPVWMIVRLIDAIITFILSCEYHGHNGFGCLRGLKLGDTSHWLYILQHSIFLRPSQLNYLQF